ncbi:Protein of unknown function [Noviherbaspirillum humi]|uniref:DUF3108 domain-containing protein n=2 Tax=Noviherbaspirillum humi TaxID=1688639 RepID=A0A239CH33_9BURK|nr:Protein of unknown function [Noviherbaspirillum humi]
MLALLLLSLLLHGMFINWGTGRLSFPSLGSGEPQVVSIALQPAAVAEPVPSPQAAPVPPPPAPRRKPGPRPAPAPEPVAAEPASTPPEEPVATLPAEPAAEPSRDVQDDPADAPPAPPAVAEAAASTDPAPPAAHAKPRYKALPPPSADLRFEVQSLREGQMVYGRGTISWHAANGRYAVHGNASVLFFTVLEFASEGELDDSGVAPVLYSEKRFRRSLTNTHFQRERETISFSASTASYPRQGGEQDRASVIWQLAAIGLGDATQFQPGAQIDLMVAGSRDMDPWHIRVIGEEQLASDFGTISAWHVVRNPKPGSYDQRIDIWLSPGHYWYPVKIRYTETGGDFLDMSLSKIETAASR